MLNYLFDRNLVLLQGGFPARFAGFYYYNHGPVWEAIFNVFAPLVKKKVRDRVSLIFITTSVNLI